MPLKKLDNSEIFIEHSYVARHYVKRKILEQNLISYFCSECGNDGFYNNKKLTLQLDHINGNTEDNRLQNLRFLCPNCHSQTETYAGKATTGKRATMRSCKKKFHQEKLKEDLELWEKLKTNSNIRFGEWGWKTRLAKLIPLSSQKVTPWLRRVDPVFLKSMEMSR